MWSSQFYPWARVDFARTRRSIPIIHNNKRIRFLRWGESINIWFPIIFLLCSPSAKECATETRYTIRLSYMIFSVLLIPSRTNFGFPRQIVLPYTIWKRFIKKQCNHSEWTLCIIYSMEFTLHLKSCKHSFSSIRIENFRPIFCTWYCCIFAFTLYSDLLLQQVFRLIIFNEYERSEYGVNSTYDSQRKRKTQSTLSETVLSLI